MKEHQWVIKHGVKATATEGSAESGPRIFVVGDEDACGLYQVETVAVREILRLAELAQTAQAAALDHQAEAARVRTELGRALATAAQRAREAERAAVLAYLGVFVRSCGTDRWRECAETIAADIRTGAHLTAPAASPAQEPSPEQRSAPE
jgi:hypothetical protein